MSGGRRLLTIGHSYAVGANRRLAHELARAGWDVTAVGPAVFHGDFRRYRLQPEPGEPCRVVAVPVHFNVAGRVHAMLYGGGFGALLREPWDLVHCWEEPYVAAAAQVAHLVDGRAPVVVATFQNIVKRYPPPFGWFERYTMNRAAGVVAFGRTTAETLDARGVARAPVRVIAPGVDTATFRPDPAVRRAMRDRFGWSPDVPVVGFVGRLVAEKGIAFLLRVLDGIDTPWRALVVGAGPLEPEVRAWAARYRDRVRVETSVGHDEVAAHLNAMDLLCAPSETTPAWREQFGRMLVEAFACGVAVVASSSGEIPHVVADAGVVLAERDLEAWRGAVAALTADPDRRAELGARGRRRAEAWFAWPVVARQHADFFESVIARRRAA